MSYYDDDDYENYDSQFVADLDTSSLGYDDEYRDDYGGELGGEDDYVYEEELGDLNLQSSFSDLSRTSSQSNLLQTKYKYFVIVLNKYINETPYISEENGEQIKNALSQNLIEKINFLNPKYFVLGWMVIKNKQIDTSKNSFFHQIKKKDKDLVIDDVIRYANFIIQKIYNK